MKIPRQQEWHFFLLELSKGVFTFKIVVYSKISAVLMAASSQCNCSYDYSVTNLQIRKYSRITLVRGNAPNLVNLLRS